MFTYRLRLRIFSVLQRHKHFPYQAIDVFCFSSNCTMPWLTRFSRLNHSRMVRCLPANHIRALTWRNYLNMLQNDREIYFVTLSVWRRLLDGTTVRQQSFSHSQNVKVLFKMLPFHSLLRFFFAFKRHFSLMGKEIQQRTVHLKLCVFKLNFL